MAERLVAEHPVIETWNVGSPAKIPYATMAKTTGTYRLGGNLRRESVYPVLQGSKDTAAAGLRLNLSDPLSLNTLSLTASYSPDTSLAASERTHLEAESTAMTGRRGRPTTWRISTISSGPPR